MRTCSWILALLSSITVCSCDNPAVPTPVDVGGTPAPPFSTVLNIDPRVNDTRNPVEISLDAGTYVVTPIGTGQGGVYDAWTPWASTTCGQPAGCSQTIPTTVSGWKSSYDVISPGIVSVSVEGQPLAPVPAQPSGIGLARDHFMKSATTTRYHVDEPMVYSTPQAALAAARRSSFTLDRSGGVGFSIDDIRPLADNRGGMSLRITRQ